MMRATAITIAVVIILAGAIWFPRSGGRLVEPSPATQPATTGSVIYRTDPPIEPDSCVAAWLFTRIVSPGSQVVVAEEAPGSIPFDVARSPYGRQPSKSTSRLIVERHSITDTFAVSIMKVAQELEIMPWTTNSDPFFAKVRNGLADALNSSESEQECMDRALRFIDQLRGQSP